MDKHKRDFIQGVILGMLGASIIVLACCLVAYVVASIFNLSWR
jgi:hypothetical protein